ncbi:ABC transporter substrate-binding protein [[Haemophilus] felis]|nr:ABC transporter substrate-binding protein [[Haemophilus] felis]
MLIRYLNFTTSALFGIALSLPFGVTAAPKIPQILTDNGLVYCTHATGFSFNPQTTDAGTNMNVITEQIYNKLFEIKNHSATVTPVLAKSYSISQDGKSIIIRLKRGIQFHHTKWFKPTREFNADDVVFSINRMIGRDTYLPSIETDAIKYNNPQYQIFHQQAKKVRFPYFESIKLNEKIQSVVALSPYEVQINLFEPDASILSHLASQYAIIFSQEYALQLNADDNLVQLDLLPVGTGAYQLENSFKSQYVRLVRNPNSWQHSANIDNIIIDVSTDRTGRLVKFLNNECQIASYPEVSQLGLLAKNNERFYVESVDGMNLSYLAFNFQKPMMRNEKIRQGISQAIDRKRIVKTIYHHTATVANNIIPDISWASTINTPDFDYDYNVEKARQNLSDSALSLTMWVLNEEQVYNPSPLKTAELIKQDLAKVGIDVNVRSVTRTYLIEQLKNKTEDYDIILAGWLAGNLDPDSFMRPILGCDAVNEITNLSNWCEPKFDHFMNEARNTSELRQRAYQYQQAQELILREIPIIPIANAKRMLIVNGKVKGVEMTPFGSINFQTLRLKREDK